MRIRPTRRQLLRSIASAGLLLPFARLGARSRPSPEAALADLERRSGGRLGVYALDAESGASLALRADEAFALCSTFKLLLAAAVLHEADAGRIALDATIPFGRADLVPHAPVTTRHLEAGGMRVDALAEAAQVTSDNVAANLLIRHLGGPERVTALFRALGDRRSRIDRYEPDMNRVAAGDPRDTTTPRAIATGVARIFSDQGLSVDDRARLREWMLATRTGLHRLRAGLPSDWTVGDKTGTAWAPGEPNRHNDVAMIWREDAAPVVIAAYYEAPGHFEGGRARDDAVLADTGRIVADWLHANDAAG